MEIIKSNKEMIRSVITKVWIVVGGGGGGTLFVLSREYGYHSHPYPVVKILNV